MQAKTHEGRHTARWQYGEQATDRAPAREEGAFYGGVTTESDDATDADVRRAVEAAEEPEPTGFIARVRREVLDA